MKQSAKLIMLLLLAGWSSSCEFDYKSVLASRTRDRIYVAEKILMVKSGISKPVAQGTRQLLVFSGDTMKIVRSDTILEQLTSYNSTRWLGKKKNGKIIFEGFTKDGRKAVLIEIQDPKEAVSGNLILSPVMKGSYNESLDTVRTYYRSE